MTLPWPEAARAKPPLQPPGPDARVFILCFQTYRQGKSKHAVGAVLVKTTSWATLAEAVAAAAIVPCSRACRGDHLLVFAEPDGRVRARRVSTAAEPPTPPEPRH